MTAGRKPLLRQEHVDLGGVMPRRNPGRPLPPFEHWIENQHIPQSVATPMLARGARDVARALWIIAESWLKRGVLVRHYARHRVVTVFGALEYRVLEEGRRVEGAARGFIGDRMSDGNVPIEAPLTFWGFSETLLGNARRIRMQETARLRQTLHGEGVEVDDRVLTDIERWAQGALDRYLHRYVDVTGLWRRVMAAMALDPEVLRMARRIDASKRRLGGLNTSMYDSFEGLLPALLEVERLEPVLTPLAWETRRQWSKQKIEPLQYLRMEFAKRGIGREDWRRLRTSRPRPVWQHWSQNKIRGPMRLLDFMADWIKVHRGLPIACRMPFALWDVLARTSVEPGEDRLIPPVVWPYRPAVLHDVLQHWGTPRSPSARQAFAQGDWARAVRWSAHYGGDVPARRKTTWAAVLAAANEDERRRLASALASKVRWASPIDAFTVNGVDVVPLDNPVALTEEALAMRHCADTFVNACATRAAYVFSFRDAHSGRRLATLALSRTQGAVELEDLRRLANQPPTEEDEAVAEEVIARVNGALSRRLPQKHSCDAAGQSPQQAVDALLAAITSHPDLPMAPGSQEESADAKWRRMNLPYALDIARRNPGLTVEEALRHIEDMGF